MSQNDFTLANQSFPAFRADLNSALQALASNNSGTSAPSTTFANMWWYDSTNNIMYIRNEDNDAWIKFAELDQTNDKFVLSGTLQLDDGTVSAPALTFNSDTNMGIYRGGTDILKFVTAGTDAITIDANQRLGIGTGSPAQLLHLSSSDPRINIEDTDAGGIFQIRNTSGIGYVGTLGTHPMIFYTNGIERMRLESDGDISFYEDTGTTPKLFWDASVQALSVNESTIISGGTAATTPSIQASEGGTAGAGLGVVSANDEIAGQLRIAASSQNAVYLEADPSDQRADSWLGFRVDGDNVGRFDSSGNLLVGTTDTSPWNNTSGTGILASSGGVLAAATNNDAAFYGNRLSSDGDIIQLRRDGTTVGSIGVDNSDNLYIQGNSTHVGFQFASSAVVPHKNGATIDNNVNLGSASDRFKDLYLSGGVYLGGTGSANYLDDYEEGTFDPIYLGTSNPSVTYDTTVRYGAYTKIGRICYFNLVIRTDAVSSTGSGQLRIGGLPFTSANAFSTSTRYAISIGRVTGFNNSRSDVVGEVEVSNTYIQLYYNHGSASFDTSELNTGTNDNQMEISGFYVIT